MPRPEPHISVVAEYPVRRFCVEVHDDDRSSAITVEVTGPVRPELIAAVLRRVADTIEEQRDGATPDGSASR